MADVVGFAMARHVGTLATLGALWTGTTLARADSLGLEQCNVKPTKAHTKQAKADYEEGKKLHDAGVKGAVEKFHHAYLTDCTKHELLVLLSFAYQGEGKLKEAILADELYIQKRGASLSEEDRAVIENRLHDLRGILEEQEAKERALIAAQKKEREKPPAPVLPPPRAPEERPHSKLPWIPIGVGAAAIVTGVVLVVAAESTFPNTCARHGGWAGLWGKEECQVDASDTTTIRDANFSKGMWNGGVASIVGGGALAIGGAVWLVFDRTGSRSSSSAMRVTPILSPSRVGIAGTF